MKLARLLLIGCLTSLFVAQFSHAQFSQPESVAVNTGTDGRHEESGRQNKEPAFILRRGDDAPSAYQVQVMQGLVVFLPLGVKIYAVRFDEGSVGLPLPRELKIGSRLSPQDVLASNVSSAVIELKEVDANYSPPKPEEILTFQKAGERNKGSN